YRLCRERAQLVADLGAKNAELEQTLEDLRGAQHDLVREASVRAHLQRYVSPQLADLAIANPAMLELPGDWREATVLFADIRGFTRLIESNPAPVVIGLLNEYFTEMIEVIFRHQGTVEQLVGDEIVALFGVPEPGPDVAVRAVGAAFDIGMGISSGRVRAGTIGSDPRRELIVVGQAMIAASRIQRMTRLFDAHIIVGEDTFKAVHHLLQCRDLGRLRLKGIRPRQTLYEVCGVREPGATLAST